MATDLHHFITETLYAIPEKLPVTGIPVQKPVVLPEAALPDQEIKKPVQATTKEAAGFGELGYQILNTGRCNTILITSVDPELFADIPAFGFLPKMLQAVGEDAKEVCYLNLAPEKEQVTELQLLKNYKHALVFLSEAHPFAKRLKLTHYEPKKFQQMNTVLANELAVVENDRNLKAQLWQALQNMYLSK